MEKPSRFYPLMTGLAIGFGILGDGLLRVHPLGLNLTLWTVSILAVAALLSRLHKPLPSSTYGLIGAAALFSLTFVWRDSLTLKWLSGFAVFVSFALAAQWVRALRVRLAAIVTYGLALIEGFVLIIQGAVVLVVRDRMWMQSAGKQTQRWVLASIRGVLIAVPLVVVFGGLFLSADLAYRTIVSDFFDLRELVKHIAVTFFCAWLAASVLMSLLEGSVTHVRLPGEIGRVKLGEIEAGMVMTLLDLLFLSFVVVQFRYLFGGEERIREISNLTYAEYARAGFFQLCTVVTLVLVVLLLGDWLLRDATALGKRVFRVLAGFQLLMLQVMMASAFFRMWMYQEAYGLTELRLYATAFMVWLGVVFVWFALTVVLRRKREQFAFGAFVTGLAAILVLHAVNPDACIVKVNAARLDEGKSFDARYAASLSADALPALLAVLPRVEGPERSTITRRLQSQWFSKAPLDWRTWSWGRGRAARAVREHSTLIDSSTAPVRPEHGPARITEESRQEEEKAEHDLLESMLAVQGCTKRKNQDHYVLTSPGGDQSYIETKERFRPPFRLRTRAMTDSTNARLFYCSVHGNVIFNWEGNTDQLRIHHPITRRALAVVSGKGYITTNQWHDLVWEIWPDHIRVLADGEERYAGEADFSACEGPLGIGPAWGSTVSVKSFVVEQLPGGIPPTRTLTATEGLEPVPAAKDLPGTLVFQGRYTHRSRGSDRGTGSLWVKQQENGAISALSHLHFFNETALAVGNAKHQPAYYAASREPVGRYPAFEARLQFHEDKAVQTRHWGDERDDGKECPIEPGALFDLNSRPDPYAVCNVLIRRFAIAEGESKELTMCDWGNSEHGKGTFPSYRVRVQHHGKEVVSVPAGTFQANHLVLTQLTSADSWFKKRAGHVTDFWVLDNGVIVRILRHREPYELELLDWTVPSTLPGLLERRQEMPPAGKLSGVVLDAETGEPVERSRVRVTGLIVSDGVKVARDALGEQSTGLPDDRFELDGLSA